MQTQPQLPSILDSWLDLCVLKRQLVLAETSIPLSNQEMASKSFQRKVLERRQVCPSQCFTADMMKCAWQKFCPIGSWLWICQTAPEFGTLLNSNLKENQEAGTLFSNPSSLWGLERWESSRVHWSLENTWKYNGKTDHKTPYQAGSVATDAIGSRYLQIQACGTDNLLTSFVSRRLNRSLRPGLRVSSCSSDDFCPVQSAGEGTGLHIVTLFWHITFGTSRSVRDVRIVKTRCDEELPLFSSSNALRCLEP